MPRAAEAATRFQTLGNGVGLPDPFEGRAAVLGRLLRGHPSTEALGEPGKGRSSCRRCSSASDTALGVDDHAQEDGTWAVTTTTL